MSKPWILVTPSSRGIGHALTQHLLRTTTLPIIATSRNRDLSATKHSLLDHVPSSQAHSSSPHQVHKEDLASRLAVLHLDVTDESSIQEAAARAAELFPKDKNHLHLACVVPGVLHAERSPRQVEGDAALETFRVNALGPLMCLKWFGDFLPGKRTVLDLSCSPAASSSGPEEQTRAEGADDDADADAASGERLQLPPHATWLTMSARVGSTADNRLGGWYSYRASKAAVNSLTKTFDLHLQHRSGDRAMAMAYHPGTVKTGLSEEFWGNVRKEKLFSPEFAVRKMCEVVGSRGLEDRGRVWDWEGKEVLP
ncbi:hypothetical protein BJ170DRAFT_495388 [Xylariales sp. AK1849]|nr:hypothetical protein BJ170DRAFT_495388 [Xylariales sp. AK1849]